MMKNIILILVSFMLISCKTKSNVVVGIDYRIIKIDSIKNVYILYAENNENIIKDSEIIKIASNKIETKCKRNQLTLVNKIYRLNLESLYPKNFVSHHYLGGITFNQVFIPFDKAYNVKKDLFVTKNLEGLCYKK